MAYSKQTWDTTSFVNPTRMNHIENGIEGADLTNKGITIPNKTGTLALTNDLSPTVEPVSPNTERVTILSGGAIKIGKMVCVSVTCKAKITTSNSPGIFLVPAGYTPQVESALSCVDITRGITTAVDESIPIAASTNRNVYIQKITTDHIYSINGSYICQ